MTSIIIYQIHIWRVPHTPLVPLFTSETAASFAARICTAVGTSLTIEHFRTVGTSSSWILVPRTIPIRASLNCSNSLNGPRDPATPNRNSYNTCEIRVKYAQTLFLKYVSEGRFSLFSCWTTKNTQ